MNKLEKKLPKWTIARRIVQITMLALFLTPLFLVEIEGENFIFGTLSSSNLLGISLNDPFGTLEILFATKTINWSLIAGAIIVLAFYALIRGRAFCGWVCPVNLILEMTGKLRKVFKVKRKKNLTLHRHTKIWVGAVILVLSFATSLPVFELFSPIGTIMKGLIFSLSLGLWSFIGIILLEIFFAERIWCRSLCPIGGFYEVVGKVGCFSVKINHESCKKCNRCKMSCIADPTILDDAVAGNIDYVTAGDCMLCGKCVDVCNDNALSIVPKLPQLVEKTAKADVEA